ncbi:MAG TPA: IS1595 family transposase [Xanthobacteraceae bacterium]|nr:IS1595 family transposase [Xanthobacteraceae bacterium]
MDINLTNPIFHDEAKATAHMEADRWPHGVHCPLCGSVNVHRMAGKTQAGMFLCNDCRDKFTVRTGTIFERSHIPLHKWLMATHIMAASKKSVSALQLQRMLGLGSYRTAWFMCHRVREAMKPAKVGPIGGQGRTVESDETVIGGKKHNRAYAKTEPKKHTVLALVDRDGESRSFHVANVKAKTLREAIVKTVDRRSHFVTDELVSYMPIGREFAGHTTVNHSDNEYVRLGGFAHVNTAECRFSLMKRAVFGAHHSISEAHLPRYLAEWDFKFNTRGMKDGERAALALKGAEGKRLTYRQPHRTAH